MVFLAFIGIQGINLPSGVTDIHAKVNDKAPVLEAFFLKKFLGAINNFQPTTTRRYSFRGISRDEFPIAIRHGPHSYILKEIYYGMVWEEILRVEPAFQGYEWGPKSNQVAFQGSQSNSATCEMSGLGRRGKT
jgi:hypothetical protein